MTTTGTPTPTLSRAGTLPPGITFTANSNGTATLSGTPTTAAKGPYPLTFTARNSTGTASQAFTLTVANAPLFTSAAAVTETAGTGFAYTVATTGYPTPALKAGTLPTGISFSDNGNGTGALSGTSALKAGTYTVPVTATNSGGTASQTITVTVKAAAGTTPVPAFTSPAAATAAAGSALNFTVTTVGSPTTTYTTNVTESGALPAGISLRQQRGRHRQPVRHPHRRQRRDVPGHVHGQERGRDNHPVVRADGQRGTRVHLGGRRHGDRRVRVQLHRAGHRRACPDAGRGGPCPRA